MITVAPKGVIITEPKTGSEPGDVRMIKHCNSTLILQLIMDLPMRTMSFTGGYYKDKNKFAFIAADSSSGQNIVHCFSGPMTVRVSMFWHSVIT